MFCRNLTGCWWIRLCLFTWKDIKDLCKILGIFVPVKIIYNTKFSSLYSLNECWEWVNSFSVQNDDGSTVGDEYIRKFCAFHNFSINFNHPPAKVYGIYDLVVDHFKNMSISDSRGEKKPREQWNSNREWNVSGVRLDSLIWWAYELIKRLNPFKWFCFRFGFWVFVAGIKFVTIAFLHPTVVWQ